MSDQSPNKTERCPQCDAEFVPASSPLGVCPACLLKLGVSDPAMKTPAIGPDAVVSNEPVALPVAAPAVRVWFRRPALIGVLAALVLLLLVWFLIRRSVPGAGGPVSGVIRFTVPWPDDAAGVDDPEFAVSSDGSRIALAARHQDGRKRLWIRTLQSMEWRALPNTEGAAQPFWSPDSRQIGFFAQKKLKKIDVSSGLVQTVADAASTRGGTWGRENTIVFAPTSTSPLVRVSSSGGDPQPVTSVDNVGVELSDAWPHFLPDGRTVLFAAVAPGDRPGTGGASGRARSGLYLVSLDRGDRRLLVDGATAGMFAQGFLLFVRGTELMAQPFDPVRAELKGAARSISGAERVGGPVASGGFDAAETGMLVHRFGGAIPSQLTWFGRNGEALGPASDIANDRQFSISPDGRRVVVARRDDQDGASHLWLLELDRRLTTRLTSGATYDASPVWLPDGQRIAFLARRNDEDLLCVTDANGGGQEQVLHKGSRVERLEDVSPDARFLVYSTASARAGSDLWVLALSEGKPQPLFQTAFNESEGRLSPDGRWIAYVSNESGRDEVYVRPFPGADGRWQVSTTGGSHPRWRRDGRELYFLSADATLQAVDVVAAQSPFRSGAPRMLFPMRHADDYDVTPDGRRFLIRAHIDDRNRTGLQIVLNWVEELRRDR